MSLEGVEGLISHQPRHESPNIGGHHVWCAYQMDGCGGPSGPGQVRRLPSRPAVREPSRRRRRRAFVGNGVGDPLQSRDTWHRSVEALMNVAWSAASQIPHRAAHSGAALFSPRARAYTALLHTRPVTKRTLLHSVSEEVVTLPMPPFTVAPRACLRNPTRSIPCIVPLVVPSGVCAGPSQHSIGLLRVRKRAADR